MIELLKIKNHHKRILEDAIIAAKEAGVILLEGLGKTHNVTFKGRIDLVTEYDVASEKKILEILIEKYPEHKFLAEESKQSYDLDEPALWVIDPLDGTTNYSHGYPMFCISIAYLEHSEPTIGVIFNPWSDEMFTAVKGRGAYLNGREISVSRQDELEKSLLVTGFPYDIREAKVNNVNLFNHLIMKAQAVRRDGSAALDLAYTAMGRFDAFWELKLHPWDVAAGALLVTEAGGQVTRFDGGEFTIDVPDMLASNSHLHSKMISEISSIPSDRW